RAVVARGQPSEVEEQGDALSVEEDARVARAGPPDDDEPAVEGRPRDAGEVLDDLERIAGGPGDALDLLEREGGLAHLLPLPGTADHGLVRREEGAEHVIGGLGLLAGIDALVGLEALELARGDDHLDLAGGHVAEGELSPLVGDRAHAEGWERHLGAGEGSAVSALEDPPTEVHRALLQ